MKYYKVSEEELYNLISSICQNRCYISRKYGAKFNCTAFLKSKTPLPEPSKDNKQIVIDELKNSDISVFFVHFLQHSGSKLSKKTMSYLSLTDRQLKGKKYLDYYLGAIANKILEKIKWIN